jgi:hypothetical protein
MLARAIQQARRVQHERGVEQAAPGEDERPDRDSAIEGERQRCVDLVTMPDLYAAN